MSYNIEPLLIADLTDSKGAYARIFQSHLKKIWEEIIPYDSKASEIFTVPPLTLPIEGQSIAYLLLTVTGVYTDDHEPTCRVPA